MIFKEQNKYLILLVVKGDGQSLLGRNLLAELKLEWVELYLINNHGPSQDSELGEAKGVTAKLHVSNNTKPYFCRARPVSYALKGKVE